VRKNSSRVSNIF